jgi:hypothetical protein
MPKFNLGGYSNQKLNAQMFERPQPPERPSRVVIDQQSRDRQEEMAVDSSRLADADLVLRWVYSNLDAPSAMHDLAARALDLPSLAYGFAPGLCYHGNDEEKCDRCLYAWQAKYGGA